MSDYNRNNNNNSFDPSWLFIIIAFAVFWPVGVGLLIYKLSQSDKVPGGQAGLAQLPGRDGPAPPRTAGLPPAGAGPGRRV